METKFYIEPEDAIESEGQLINEIIIWAERENKQLEIVETGENLIVKIDGSNYRVKLEPPKRVMTKMGIALGAAILEYKCIYFYEC